MRKAIIFIVICLVLSVPGLALCETEKNPRGWTGNVNLFLGGKFLDKDNWEPVENQIEGGILIDVKQNRFPASIALDLLCSKAEDDIGVLDLGIGKFHTNVESQIMEFDLGIRKIWEAPRHIRPYIGGGLAIINGDLKAESLGVSVSDNDTGFGMWADIGLYGTLYGRYNLGIDARWSKAEVELFGTEARVGGWHVGALAGFHW